MTAAGLSGIRAAIIDLDGTMVDTALDFHIALNRTREDLALPPLEIEIVRRYVGKGFRNLVRGTLATEMDEHSVELLAPQAFAAFLQHYTEVNGDHSKLFPDVIPGLRVMRDKGLKLACVTNKQTEFTLPLLRKMALHDYFDVIYCGDSLPKMKPDPLPMQTVFADFGLAPNEVVAIGDSVNDSQAARAAGCAIWSVPYGYNHGRPVQEIDSDGIVETLLAAANRLT
ncbi:MAG: phosphoglycolate phosphatase [Burkholderiaceae bacterium]|nr:phosphoglycolate phosphatase [Burkholderiaceae bacterium]